MVEFWIFAAPVLGYLLGSIPFGLILTRFAGTADLRSIGSGNIGATNVLRTGRKDLAAATLLLDALKGTAAVVIAWIATGDDGAALLAAAGAFFGHLFPVWIGFKGGKGVATYLGALYGFWWPAGVAFSLVWLALAYLFRLSSLSALTASVLTPVLLAVTGQPRAATVFLILTAFLWWKHRANIGRLIAGTETRIGQKA